MHNLKTHWENIYETKPESDFSWFQPYPQTSLYSVAFSKLLNQFYD